MKKQTKTKIPMSQQFAELAAFKMRRGTEREAYEALRFVGASDRQAKRAMKLATSILAIWQMGL